MRRRLALPRLDTIKLVCWSGAALERPLSENPGGLNGSMQHLLDDSLKEPGKLISCVGINPNKSKALFRF